MGLRRLSVLCLSILFASLGVGPGHAQLPDVPLPPLPVPDIPIGDLLDSLGVDPPPDGMGLVLFADFPLSHPFEIDGVAYSNVTLDVTNEGVETKNAVPASETQSSDSIGECEDQTYGAASGRMWWAEDLPVDYQINVSSIPGYLDRTAVVRSIRAAHKAWAATNSRCDDGDPIQFEFHYGGKSEAHNDPDGSSVIDFGLLDQAVAVTYAWYSDSRIVEADMRINTRYTYGTSPRTKKYNVLNLVTHETGHQVGLDDLADPHGSLTMFGRVLRGEFFKTTLGTGDIQGAEAQTP